MEQPTTKLATINKTRADKQLADQRHKELTDSSVKVSETVVSVVATLIEYLEGKVSKTEVVNQLDTINTPDVFEVKNAIDALHATLKTHKNTDLTGITTLLQGVLDEAKKIPKELPKTEKQQFIDYTEQIKGIKELIPAITKAIKEQKLIVEAPIVNVDSPTVNVESPDLKPLQTSLKAVETAIKKIVIKEFKLDNKGLETLVKKSNELLKKLLDKPVSSGGGGGGVVSFVGSNGYAEPVVKNADGSVPIADNQLPTAGNNPSTALSYDINGDLQYIDETINGVTYRTTLTYTARVLVGISEAVEL